MLSAIIQNTEAQRTRSFRPRTLSVISVPLCFKPFLAEKMKGLIRELATQFHESEKLQSAIRDNMQKRFSKYRIIRKHSGVAA